MDRALRKGKTKRRNDYTVRLDRKTSGYSKVLADCAKYKKTTMQQLMDKEGGYRKLLTLAVKGTFDPLANLMPISKNITVEHPVDKEYTKKVKVLSDKGRIKLKLIKERRKR